MKKITLKWLTILGATTLTALPFCAISCSNEEKEIEKAEKIIGDKELTFKIDDLKYENSGNSILQSARSIAGPWRKDFLKVVITSKSNIEEYWKDNWIVGKIDLKNKAILFLIPREVLLDADFIKEKNMDLKSSYQKANKAYLIEKPKKVYSNLKNKEILINNYTIFFDDINNDKSPRVSMAIKELKFNFDQDRKTIEIKLGLRYELSQKHNRKSNIFFLSPKATFKYILSEEIK